MEQPERDWRRGRWSPCRPGHDITTHEDTDLYRYGQQYGFTVAPVVILRGGKRRGERGQIKHWEDGSITYSPRTIVITDPPTKYPVDTDWPRLSPGDTIVVDGIEVIVNRRAGTYIDSLTFAPKS